MDRSFLSHPEVVAASRRFVCARLATYEDAEEVKLLTSIYARGGQLQNSVFCILSPVKNEKLTRAGRSPHMVFESADHMAESMHELAAEYAPTQSKFEDLGLPYLKDVRLGLNVAACDSQPLIVVHSKDGKVPKRLAKLSWHKPAIGKFLFAHAGDAKSLAKLQGAGDDAGILFVEPNAFGSEGKVVARLPLDASESAIHKAMTTLQQAHDGGAKSSSEHIREAKRRGIRWEPATPVTDNHSRNSGSRRGRREDRGERRRRRRDR